MYILHGKNYCHNSMFQYAYHVTKTNSIYTVCFSNDKTAILLNNAVHTHMLYTLRIAVDGIAARGR